MISQHGELNGWGPPGSKTDRDHLMKDNLVHYCPKTFAAKGKKERDPGFDSR